MNVIKWQLNFGSCNFGLVISNRTRAARSFDFEITRMVSHQTALHSVQLPLQITSDLAVWRSSPYNLRAHNKTVVPRFSSSSITIPNPGKQIEHNCQKPDSPA